MTGAKNKIAFLLTFEVVNNDSNNSEFQTDTEDVGISLYNLNGKCAFEFF